jgi:hypothetical protein
LREIAARDPSLRADVFAKVGDSMTASDDFMRCFALPSPVLGEHAALLPVIERFRAATAAGEDSFRRRSAAARIGWSAWQVLEGRPSPLEREVSAIRPRFALVQFGTNDLELGKVTHFALRLLDVTDALTARGVIPILFTIPRRKDRSDRGDWVPRYNAIVRAIAQSRQTPFVDYHRELARLPGQGLGKDGIHPSTYRGPRGRDACSLDREALRHGYNLRNLLALEALGRAVHALGTGAPLDPVASTTPLPITQLPFVDARRALARTPDEPGPRCSAVSPALDRGVEYPLELSERTPLQVTVFAAGASDTAISLRRRADPRECVGSGREAIVVTVPPGSYDLVVRAESPAPGSAAPEIFLTLVVD